MSVNQRIKIIVDTFCSGNQSLFADSMKVTSRKTAYNWLKEGYNVKEATIDHICLKFGVSYEWLKNGEGKMMQEIPGFREEQAEYGSPKENHLHIMQQFIALRKEINVITQKLDDYNTG